MKAKKKPTKRLRSAGPGRFVSPEQAKGMPKEQVVAETVERVLWRGWAETMMRNGKEVICTDVEGYPILFKKPLKSWAFRVRLVVDDRR